MPHLPNVKFTQRQHREKEYYEKYFEQNKISGNIDFSPIDGVIHGTERRPWNSYWRTYEVPIISYRELTSKMKTEVNLLDFGCGPGDNALRFSRAGFKVTGFDICENNIESCKTLFKENNVEGHFIVSVAEELPFADESFEVVAGIDILHHVDIVKSIKEVRRVLKKGALAIFREPIEVPILDNLRNTTLVKMFIPNKPSFEKHITEDERKLNKVDLELIENFFPDITVERSLILSRLDKFVRSRKNTKASFLEKVDHTLCKYVPYYKNLGGAAVIIFRKRHDV
ncbi:class I SAM-dependent methyltransferase [Bacteriovorax sp. PP10]|uniref:Class I SAM-dependent methyltransferase n=1 Tax=Bacteriovorax antarcticus TaxID=3088717 RepID=A0ABU5VRI1_9BACT|nr:class I SAM-dependent methyltransferase [Bacteriovorax sp. PP10]MEA9355660.1 class I SAM-dependent methyltransferase [Bacteriovorax sp. PP10]